MSLTHLPIENYPDGPDFHRGVAEMVQSSPLPTLEQGDLVLSRQETS